MKYTRVPEDAFKHLQMNAGILADGFNPATGEVENLLGATTGGISFASNPSFSDFGADMDNVPKNTMELMQLEGYDPAASGTFLTVSAASIKSLVGAAKIDEQNAAHIVPRNKLETTDFTDIWMIGDYSDKNTGDAAGFLAIHLKNALNTSGFSIKTVDKNKGQMAFDYHAHYSLASQDEVPFEIYCKEGN